MKKWLIVAGCLIVVGLMIGTVAMALVGFDFAKLGMIEMVTNTYTVEESFTNISLDAITADITFAASEEGVKVVCHENEKVPFSAYVEGDVLVISCKDNRKWYDHIGFIWEKSTVTVYLPAGEYGDLQVDCTTGDVKLPAGFAFQSAEVSVTTGDAQLEGFACQKLRVKSTTGNVTLTDVQATEAMNLTVSTGDVKLNRVDSRELQVKTTTGNVTGTLLSEKVFDVKATTGDVTVPQSTTGGLCRVTTTTGDIYLKIAE